MRIATRLFVRNVWLQAVLMAFAATLCAEFLWSPAPATYTALEWAPYDTWMRLRSHPAHSSHLLLVVRDHASEQQFGVGHWDRSIPARLVTALHDAGATALGIDIPLDLPSPPNLGGAVSDTLLIEAVKSAGTVVYPALPTSTLEQDTGLPTVPSNAVTPGRSAIQPALDIDRIVRRAPLYHDSGSGELPALGFTLATTFWRVPLDQVERRSGQVLLRNAREPDGAAATVTIPVDRKGRLLINFAGPHPDRIFSTVTFLELSRLIDQKDNEGLTPLINGKAVILLTQPRPQPERTIPSGDETSDFIIQTHLLHTLLSQDWIRDLSPLQRLVVTFVLCLCLAWMVLRWADWKGLLLGMGG
ncbi:MAG: CHASE2 domain-containing protein, partial [Nitrospira defluvii]|nr:CHASE2 domain-containing protein [Nitrospira defluvii]